MGVAGYAGGEGWRVGGVVKNKAEVGFLSEDFRLAEAGG